MLKWHYHYAGLRISSELELPEWETFRQPAPDDIPDVIFRYGSAETQGLSPDMIVGPDECRFSAPDVGIYHVIQGREIVVSPYPGAGLNEIRLFLLGSGWGAICYQRGLFALHASAVRVGQDAVLFCANPGGGKSTITAFLAARGHAVISDDLCCIEMATPIPEIYPSARRLRLWQDALDALGWNNSALQRDHFRMDKFHLPWEGEPVLSPVPIKGIYLLEWGDFTITRLTGMNALRGFIAAATYRGELLDQMGLSASYWQRCLDLVKTVPVWRLQRRKNFAEIIPLAESLERHWAGD